uniref:HDC13104 n=1 Tax=Drosophila melanogaster TaxID=7227 RepID=Q6IK93_DROME|nr:TPA_inf: HDC13104 [Drosophila melanogaster]
MPRMPHKSLQLAAQTKSTSSSSEGQVKNSRRRYGQKRRKIGRSHRAKHNQLHHQCDATAGGVRLLRWQIATPLPIYGHVMNQAQKVVVGLGCSCHHQLLHLAPVPPVLPICDEGDIFIFQMRLIMSK